MATQDLEFPPCVRKPAHLALTQFVPGAERRTTAAFEGCRRLPL